MFTFKDFEYENINKYLEGIGKIYSGIGELDNIDYFIQRSGGLYYEKFGKPVYTMRLAISRKRPDGMVENILSYFNRYI